MSSIPTPSSSSRRTASAITPERRAHRACCTLPSSNVGRSAAISLQRGHRRARRRAASSSVTSSRSPPTRSLSSSEVPSAITLPWSITTIRSASRSASSRYCVVSSTVVPCRDALLDHLPEAEPAARVQPGGRLVQEQHGRAEDERGGQVQPPAHAARVRLRRAARAASVRSKRSSSSSARLRASARAQVVEPPDHLEVLEAGQVLVDRRVLPGEPDLRAQRVRVACTTSSPATRALPPSGLSSVARIRTAVVLPAPFGPSRPSTVPVCAGSPRRTARARLRTTSPGPPRRSRDRSWRRS